jgi:hypothetical protein
MLGLACGLALTASLSAQPTPNTPQPPAPPNKVQPAVVNPYPPPLYQMNDVSKSLNLTQDQLTKLNKLTEQTQTQYHDDYTKLGTLNDADRFTRTQELNRRYYSDWTKESRDIFNDTQRARYQQYNYQYGGFDTLYDSDVQKRLNLTAEQQKNLRAQWDWSNQQLQDIHRAGTSDATKGTQMYRDYWKARDERFYKFLTADQQKAWNEMVGDPYTFQPSFTPPR